MCSVPFLVVTGALLAVAGYYLYVPFPEQASDPWRKSFVSVAFQIQKLLVIIYYVNLHVHAYEACSETIEIHAF